MLYFVVYFSDGLKCPVKRITGLEKTIFVFYFLITTTTLIIIFVVTNLHCYL